ncbi:MAG: hypothetical protein IT340_13430 [Chloroflexi bacterium]|nr:hypothetical protein [Chloroflexota bacterium]
MLETLETKDTFAREVLAHLCGSTCHGFGEAIEMCETRGDCVIVITCPSCGRRFTLEDDQYDMLIAWSRTEGSLYACGVQPLHA